MLFFPLVLLRSFVASLHQRVDVNFISSLPLVPVSDLSMVNDNGCYRQDLAFFCSSVVAPSAFLRTWNVLSTELWCVNFLGPGNFIARLARIYVYV